MAEDEGAHIVLLTHGARKVAARDMVKESGLADRQPAIMIRSFLEVAKAIEVALTSKNEVPSFDLIDALFDVEVGPDYATDRSLRPDLDANLSTIGHRQPSS